MMPAPDGAGFFVPNRPCGRIGRFSVWELAGLDYYFYTDV